MRETGEGGWSGFLFYRSIAVGFKGFVEATKERLGVGAKGRKVFSNNGAYELREAAAPYKGDFDPENGVLRLENTYFWNDSPLISIR